MMKECAVIVKKRERLILVELDDRLTLQYGDISIALEMDYV